MSEKTDYRAIVERIAEILHGSVTDVDLLTVTVQAMKERNTKLERERRLAVESNSAVRGGESGNQRMDASSEM